jgi:hypothetical protein
VPLRTELLLLVAITVAVGACTSSSGPSEQATSASREPTGAGSGSPVATVGCDAAIGGGQPSPGWRRYAIEVGPLTFVGVRLVQPDDRAFVQVRGRSEALKFPVLIEGAVQVMLTVPAKEVGRVSLLYDPRTWSRMRNGRYRISDGDREVAFEACGGSTWFAGGLVVSDGPRCAALDVSTAPSTPVERVVLPLGVPSCPAT